jgi:hypothetical protein
MSPVETVIFGVFVVVALFAIGALFFAFLTAEDLAHRLDAPPTAPTFDTADDDPAPGRCQRRRRA